MTDKTHGTFTAREIVDIKRAAARDAALEVCDQLQKQGKHIGQLVYLWEGATPLAERLFPYPKVTRPRVVTNGLQDTECQFDFRLVNGTLEYACHKRDDWEEFTKMEPGDWPILISIITDLLANPTETVDDA